MSAAATAAQPQLRVVAVGHVDHGKSTLIGRLLHDSGNLPDGKVAELAAVSERRGVAFEWSFVLDALQSEREQAVTIDTTRIWMRTPERDVVLIDAPGHKEFLRNMVTGASDADAALLVVDAHDGVGEQTRRHTLLLELIGVMRVVVAINKMDRVGYDRARFETIRNELELLFERVGIRAAAFVATCARDGENVVTGAPSMPWYDGPTILQALLALPAAAGKESAALRVAVQGIVRRDLERIVVGRIESGTLCVGDDLIVAPSRRSARIASFATFPPSRKAVARAGESVGFVLDGPLFVERGDVIAHAAQPPSLAKRFRARLLWLGQSPLGIGDAFRMRFGTRVAVVKLSAFERVIDLESLDRSRDLHARTNDVAEVVFTSSETLPLDPVAEHPGLARFILLDGVDIVAGGTILSSIGDDDGLPANVVPVPHTLRDGARSRLLGHRGAVLWLTGLPAAGKSTIAMEVERRLVEAGAQAYVLDGDNVRAGLCRDLGFSAEDRRENIRRVGAVAALFADAGTIAIAAFISPYRAGREDARKAAGDAFHEVFVKAHPDVCEQRDPKGHYRQARAGKISDFTGITGDYEEPEHPEIVLDTNELSLDACVETILDYVDRHIAFASAGRR
ncbi:MAG: adenylyl-sulfate kinase [Candidatus Eremiobacteraeota bacterium]|nr:adenylyl-sulfate kinase [Candidatus Eremiobacteraeota bacterium]